ncbi:hypothetical protein AAF463_11590 [Pantoea sp. BJ2]|uniref:Uncharacterized protein n=1 Tax=Pantoea sp. BJ2 TaxID=3141322 RepID=A0AAU7TRD6_9GAMM
MINPDDIKAGYTLGHADAQILRVAVKELLALRKAFSEPFCFTDDAGIDLWHMNESFEVWPEIDGDISIPLFRKPVID